MNLCFCVFGSRLSLRRFRCRSLSFRRLGLRSFCLCRSRLLYAHIEDCARRALLGAHSAVLALFRIDVGKVIHNVDSVKLTCLFALAASDTSVGTCLPGLCALCIGMTLYDYDVLCRGYSDELVRARSCACSAGYAVISVYYRNTVTDVNGVKLTGGYAVTQSDTSVRALVYSAEELLCGRTRLHSGVLQKRLCSLVSSVTHNDRNFLFGGLGSYAENLSQGGSHVRAACGTFVARQGMIRRQSVGIVVAARISASAAVGARKLLSQKSERLVYRYEEYLGSDCKYACAYETDYYYDQYRF